MNIGTFDTFNMMTSTPRQFPDIELKDINGKIINIKQLANDYQLILITLKSTVCMVCPQLLLILNMYGLNPNCTTYQDIFTQEEYVISETQKKFFSLILSKDAYFIVMCPGANDDDIAEIQIKSDFRYPFIASHQVMELGKALKLNMSENELWPAIMEITKDQLDVYPIYIGRSPGHYHHNELLELLIGKRNQCESYGFKLIGDAYDRMSPLKRRITKCETRSLIPKSFSFIKKSTAATTENENTSLTTIPLTSSATTTHSDTQLPPELLDLIFSNITDIKSLVRLSRTSRHYYICVCNALISRLRLSIHHLQNALPEDYEEHGKINISLNRWKEKEEGIGYRELEQRVYQLKMLLDDIGLWTTKWSNKKKITPGNTFLSGPIPPFSSS